MAKHSAWQTGNGAGNERVRMLRDHLLAGLMTMEEVHINGDMEHRVPHNLNLSFNLWKVNR